jgi:hypothetical protein
VLVLLLHAFMVVCTALAQHCLSRVAWTHGFLLKVGLKGKDFLFLSAYIVLSDSSRIRTVWLAYE